MADPTEADVLEPTSGYQPEDDEVLKAILNLKPTKPEKAVATPRVPEGEGEPTPDPENPVEDDESEAPDKEKDEAEGEEEKKEDLEVEDVDELLVAVTVNGEEVEIPLKDLKQNYSGNKFIEQNVQKAVEIRKAVEYNAAALYHTNQQAMEKLQSLDAVLDTLASPAVDWDALKARNPQEYILKREELRDIQDKQRLVREEVGRVEAEQAALQAQARQRLLLDQAQILADRVPELADPKKAPVVMGQMSEAAKYYGFSPEEVGQVIDHRQMLVLLDAAKWRRQEAEKSKVLRKANGSGDASASETPRKVLLRPGSSQGSSANSAKRLTADAYNRARQSGKVEDVALTLLMPKRK